MNWITKSMRHPSSLITHFGIYPEVRQLLEDLIRELKAVLPDQLVGVYLFGSLTGDSFDRHSDIDVAVVIEEPISATDTDVLSDMHQNLAAIPEWCSDQLEISYIPRASMRHHDPSDNVHLHLDRGRGKQLEMTRHDEDWVIQRYVLRERGIVLHGPDPKELIDPVSIAEVQQATSSLLNTWLAGFAEEASAILTVGYQSYLVLTVCRVLYTLVEGDVVSKQMAVEWAKAALDERWKTLIDSAWQDRRDPNRPVSRRAVNELQEFLRHALDIESDRSVLNR